MTVCVVSKVVLIGTRWDKKSSPSMEMAQVSAVGRFRNNVLCIGHRQCRNYTERTMI